MIGGTLRRLARYARKAALEPRYALRVAWMRGRSLALRLLPGGRAAIPETISLYLTHRCNLRCRMCGQWNREGGSNLGKGESAVNAALPLAAYVRLFDEVAPHHPNITLFGGEPLLLAEFGALVAAAKSRGLRVNMVSNMALAYERAEEIVRSGLDEIIVSLDGPRAVHDGIRGMPGTFNRVVNGLLLIERVKRGLGRTTPRINLSCTMSRLNLAHLEELVGLARFLKAGTLTFHHLMHVSRETYERSALIFEKAFGVTPADFAGFDLPPDVWRLDAEALIAVARRIRAQGGPVPVGFYPDLTDAEVRRFYTPDAFVPDSHPGRCVSPWITAYVFPDGSVRPCLSTGYDAGNLLAEPFLAIWNGAKLRRFREDLKGRGRYPFCTKCTEFYRF